MVLTNPRTARDIEATAGELPRHMGGPTTFAELLDQTRRKWGNKTAAQEKHRREWRRISHAEVYERSYRIASGLVALGLQKGDRVTLTLENSIDWMCAYYGIVLAGGVGVPIYYDLKPAEVGAMAAHAEPAMAIISPKVIARIEPELPASVRTLIIAGDGSRDDDAIPSSLRREGRETLTLVDLESRATGASRRQVAEQAPGPHDLASIVFTSGTSGGMKGVMLTHRNILANSMQVQASIPFDEKDRLVVVLPLHHAFPFTLTMAIAPDVGGEVTFENDLRRIRDRMAEVKPTLFLGVPALFEVMYRNIVKSIEAQGRLETFEKGLRIVEATKKRTGINIGRIVFRELHKRLGGSFRFMVSGGAALNPKIARDFALLGVPIIQGWGLSEAAPVLSAQRWSPRKFYMSNHYEDHFGSIGEPIEGVEIGLIDVPEKELYVHLHGEGELVARGENITPGYWRAPEESEAIKVGGWLRTGDVGYIDDEGQIWITGRSKFVIVLDSGEKVHPDEIEEKVERSELVQDIVVFGRKVRGKTQVMAVIYPNRDAVLARASGDVTLERVGELVRAGVAAQSEDIAAYKRITEILLTDTPLPRTPLRKVMRGSIRESYEFSLDRWSETWRDVLAAETLPPDDADTSMAQ
jgi:long-chain acyl-CoA synthetase